MSEDGMTTCRRILPPGYAIVPKEPTDAMIDAYAHAGDSVFFSSNEAKARWAAMLAAVE